MNSVVYIRTYPLEFSLEIDGQVFALGDPEVVVWVVSLIHPVCGCRRPNGQHRTSSLGALRPSLRLQCHVPSHFLSYRMLAQRTSSNKLTLMAAELTEYQLLCAWLGGCVVDTHIGKGSNKDGLMVMFTSLPYTRE